jgi:hypothetical protein
VNVLGWWHSYDDVLPAWFETYVGLEEASLIRTHEVQFIPSLLQTRGRVTLAGRPDLSSEERSIGR